MSKPKNIIDMIKEDLDKSRPKDRNPTTKQIIEGLAGKIHEQLKDGRRLDDIYEIIHARLPEDTRMSLSTFKRYWHEARDAAGLPKIKNSGRKKNAAVRSSRSQVAHVTPTADQTATRGTSSTTRQNRTSGDFREDPDDI